MAESTLNVRELLSYNMKFYRKKKCLSQEKLGFHANLSSQMVCEIEGLSKWVSDRSLYRIANALSVDVFQLFVPPPEEDIDLNADADLYNRTMTLKDLIEEDICKRFDQFYIKKRMLPSP